MPTLWQETYPRGRGGGGLNVSKYKVINSRFLYILVLLSDFDNSRPVLVCSSASYNTFTPTAEHSNTTKPTFYRILVPVYLSSTTFPHPVNQKMTNPSAQQYKIRTAALGSHTTLKLSCGIPQGPILGPLSLAVTQIQYCQQFLHWLINNEDLGGYDLCVTRKCLEHNECSSPCWQGSGEKLQIAEDKQTTTQTNTKAADHWENMGVREVQSKLFQMNQEASQTEQLDPSCCQFPPHSCHFADIKITSKFKLIDAWRHYKVYLMIIAYILKLFASYRRLQSPDPWQTGME